VLSGVGFGVTSLAVRVLDISSVEGVLTNGATYALVIGGLGGYLSYALAIRRGSVTAATAVGTLMEITGPGLVGILLLHDRPRPGYGWLALTGLVLTAAGTLALSRFAEVRT
jgi:drug/metabolite transporter (DMT)-like permease